MFNERMVFICGSIRNFDTKFNKFYRTTKIWSQTKRLNFDTENLFSSFSSLCSKSFFFSFQIDEKSFVVRHFCFRNRSKSNTSRISNVAVRIRRVGTDFIRTFDETSSSKTSSNLYGENERSVSTIVHRWKWNIEKIRQSIDRNDFDEFRRNSDKISFNFSSKCRWFRQSQTFLFNASTGSWRKWTWRKNSTVNRKNVRFVAEFSRFVYEKRVERVRFRLDLVVHRRTNERIGRQFHNESRQSVSDRNRNRNENVQFRIMFDRKHRVVLALDLWEHGKNDVTKQKNQRILSRLAYYLVYENRRNEYVENFWRIVNWSFVEKMFLENSVEHFEL